MALCDVKKDIAAVTFEVEQEGMGEQVGDLHILFCKLSGSIFANIYLQKWPFLQSRKLNMSIVQPYDDRLPLIRDRTTKHSSLPSKMIFC